MKVMAKDGLIVARIKQGYNLSEFARELGIQRQTLSGIEKRHHSIGPSLAKGVCEILEMDFDDLFELVPVTRQAK